MKNPFPEGYLNAMPLYFRILVAMALWFISYALVTFLGLSIASAITGIQVTGFNIEQLERSGPAFATGLKIIQLFSDLGLFVAPALLFPIIVFQKSPVAFMGMKKRTSLIVLALAICLALCIQPVVTLSAWLNEQMKLPAFLGTLEQQMKSLELKNEKLMEQFLKMNNAFDFFINILIIAVLPAIAEELFFRGFVQKTFQKGLRRGHAAVFITAFIFSFIHLEFYGFLPRFLLGLLLGYAYLWTNDIKVPIIIHFTNNFLDLCLSYSLPQQAKAPDAQNTLGATQFVFCFISLFALAALLYIFKVRARQSQVV